MNARQLEKLGVPRYAFKTALLAIQQAAAAGQLRGKNLKETIHAIVAAPQQYAEDAVFGPLARELAEAGPAQPPAEPIAYRTWGTQIDDASHAQMRQACQLPVARAAALMPDAHVGYGLPIGGVLGLENAVAPYAVGVDIACRMKLSVLDLPVWTLKDKFNLYKEAVEGGTRFGVGGEYRKPFDHEVMDRDWSITPVTRENRDKAWHQLGTSGSGNHFVEFGVLKLELPDAELRLDAGEYVALLSHSGSRGTGAAVCSVYSNLARVRLPKRYEDAGRLAWLDLDTHEGQAYWAAMNLMGDYAAANHDVIHRQVSKLLGAQIVAGVENHHNFAWKELHGGRELIVHRKGATPAAPGQLGVIPGSMADPAYVVRGRGNPESLMSASHGAGRRMSRTAARDKYRFKAVQADLARRGIRVLSAGADEVPGVYKDIRQVMAEQSDLVDVVAEFQPKIVKMSDDGSKAED
ncbi:MAG: RtcB family protein [Pirellulales bacterium]|nr:RtcB family protein [Pirellulales bacterium]